MLTQQPKTPEALLDDVVAKFRERTQFLPAFNGILDVVHVSCLKSAEAASLSTRSFAGLDKVSGG